MTEPIDYKQLSEELYQSLKTAQSPLTLNQMDVMEKYENLHKHKKKLYKVSLSTEFMVYAESVGDAETIARRNLSSETPELGYVYEIEKESELDEWKGCIPYGEENERTCEVILND